MKNNEFRIGNILRYGNPIHKDLPIVKIDQIWTHLLWLEEVDGKKSNIHPDNSNLNGIPLTPELWRDLGAKQIPLEKNENYHANQGKNFGYPVLYLNKVSYLAPNSSTLSTGYLFLSGLRIECKYLHTLQNLYFSLTGIELNIPEYLNPHQ